MAKPSPIPGPFQRQAAVDSDFDIPRNNANGLSKARLEDLPNRNPTTLHPNSIFKDRRPWLIFPASRTSARRKGVGLGRPGQWSRCGIGSATLCSGGQLGLRVQLVQFWIRGSPPGGRETSPSVEGSICGLPIRQWNAVDFTCCFM